MPCPLVAVPCSDHAGVPSGVEFPRDTLTTMRLFGCVRLCVPLWVTSPGETAAAVLGVFRFGRPGSSSRNCDVLIEPTPEISQLGNLGISGISTRLEEVGSEKNFFGCAFCPRCPVGTLSARYVYQSTGMLGSVSDFTFSIGGYGDLWLLFFLG